MRRTTRTGTRMARLLVLSFIVLLTASCATAGSREKKIRQSLKLSLEAFNRDIRWQDYQSAQAFVPKDQITRYWAEIDKLKRDTRMTGFEVRDMEFSNHDHSASAMVHFRYWKLDSPILRGVTLTQKWRFNGEGKELWKVSDTGFKAFTGASSGF